MNVMDYRIANTTFDRNARAISNVENRQDCHVCGKAVNSQTCEAWIAVDTDGFLIEVGIQNANLKGFYPVGPECAKKIDSIYIHTITMKVGA